MTGETGNFLNYGLELVLCLGGLHGIFYYSNLGKKAAAWCALQTGLLLFILQRMPNAHPLPLILALEGMLTGAAVALLLAVFCWKLKRRHKTLEGPEIARRVFK